MNPLFVAIFIAQEAWGKRRGRMLISFRRIYGFQFRACLAIFAILLSLPPIFSEEEQRSRPDLNDFIDKVKKKLLDNNEAVKDYVYRVKTMDSGMGLKMREEYEIYHFKKCEACSQETDFNAVQYYIYPFRNHTYEKRLHSDAPPEKKEDPQPHDGINTKIDLLEWGKKPSHLTEEEEKREAQREIDEYFGIFDITWLGKEELNGHPAMVLTFAPKKNAKPKSSLAKFIKHLEGKIWVEENEHEIMKIDARAIDNISVVAGPLAKIEKGAQFIQERRKINNEVWLPFRTESNYKLKILFVPTSTIRELEEYYDYRKFTVDTKVTYEEKK